MLYRGKGDILRHIALQDGSNTFGSYIIKTIGKKTEELAQRGYKKTVTHLSHNWHYVK